METDSSRSSLPFALGLHHVDLSVLVLVLGATAAAVTWNAPAVVGAPLSVVTVFVLPGYALTVALFPKADASVGGPRMMSGAVTALDRVVATVGLSVATVALSAFVLNASSYPLAPRPLFGAVAASTLLFAAVAVLRRRGVPAAERFQPVGGGAIRSSLGDLDALSILLAVCVLFAGSAVAYSVGVQDEGEGVTALYLQGESPSDDPASETGAYPTTLTVGSPEPYELGIENREGAEQTYVVVAQLQRVRQVDGGVVVEDRRRVFARSVTVASGATRTLSANVTADSEGTYRLTFLLYRGKAPAEPRVDSAYREVHLYVTVHLSTEASVR